MMYRVHVVPGLQLNQRIPNLRTTILQAYMMIMLVLTGDICNAREELSVDQTPQSTYIDI